MSKARSTGKANTADRAPSAPRLLRAGGLVLWLTIVLAAYYAVHKPLPPNLAAAGLPWSLLAAGWSPAALLASLGDLAFVSVLGVIAFGAGTSLLRSCLRLRVHDPYLVASAGLCLGLGALALAFLGLAALGLLRPAPGWAVLGVFAVLGAGPVWRRVVPRIVEAVPDARQAPGALRLGSPRPWGSAVEGETQSPLLFKVALAVLALFLTTRALTPPVAWDALVYHLAGPQRYIDAGGMVPGIDIPHLYFPFLVEQLFTAALLLRNDAAAQLIPLLFAAAAIAGVFGFLRRWSGPRSAWIGPALLLSVPSLLTLAAEPYVEWALLAIGFLAFWTLWEGLEAREPRWLAASGLLAGLALSAKYTGVFIVAPLGAYLLWRWPAVRRQAASFPRLRHGFLWAAMVFLVDAPWLLRDLLLTGNPVYPFLFGGWNWDAWKTEWFSRAGTGLVTEPWRLLAAPWELTVLGREGGLYDAALGPLFLALLPLPLLLRPPVRWLGAAVWLTAAGYAAWLYGAGQSQLLEQGRLLLPVLPFAACLIAVAVANAGRIAVPGFQAAWFFKACVGLVLTLAVAAEAGRWAADPPLPYLLGVETREAFLARHLGGYYRVMEFVNAQLPAGARVLQLWEPRSYRCRAGCQPDALLYNWRYLLHREGGSEGVYRALRRDGYTHVLLYGGGLRYFSEPPNVEAGPEHVEELRALEAHHLERLYGPPLDDTLAAPLSKLAGGSYAVYAVR